MDCMMLAWPVLPPPGGVCVPLAADDRLIDETSAAGILGMSSRTLARHRSAGTGPAWVRIGKARLAYRLSDVQAWRAGHVMAAS